jgi:hypothetical protein
MISTVTTSTVSTFTNAALAGSLALIGIVLLLMLLVQKELASASSGKWVHRLNKALNIGIVPLLFVFMLVVASKVVEVLR